MGRLGRWTHNALTTLSLAACLASISIGLRSYGNCDQLWCGWVRHDADGQDHHWLNLGSDRGGCYVSWEGYRYPLDLLNANHDTRLSDGWHRGWRTVGSSGLYPYQGIYFMRVGAPEAFRFAGFQLTTGLRPSLKDRFRRHTLALVVPIWFLTLLTALLPARSLVRYLRRRSLPPDVRPCPRCGYDLRATPDRCPECGTASPKQQAG